MIDNVDYFDNNSRLAPISEKLSANFPHLDLAKLNLRWLVLVEGQGNRA
jgi:hypothetical protein